MTGDEMRRAARRYQRAEPVTDFPPLPAEARTGDMAQMPAMHRAIARLWLVAACPADTIAFEAQSYIAGRQGNCAHAWVTVEDHQRPVYRECAYCDRRRR